jgi:hypothetical protein
MEMRMSLTIGSNFGANSQAFAPERAAPSGGAAVPGNLAPADGQGRQGGRGQVVDQINITSITINIDQAPSAASGSQLQLEVGKAGSPLADGGSALQPLGEGYFSSPTNFVPTGNEDVEGSSSSAASEASLTLQILSETTNASTSDKKQPSSKSGAATPTNVPPDNSAYVSVDISI